jgi:two-component system response regulator ResD
MPREKRVLVVDDDDAIRALLFTILRRRGFAVDTANNGEEAMSRSAKCRYAVVLLDLMMPKMSGYEVLERLEQESADTRPLVIVLTAGNEPRNLSPELVAGAIRKPFDIEMLVDMVRACMTTVVERDQRDGCPPPDTDGHFRRDRHDEIN